MMNWFVAFGIQHSAFSILTSILASLACGFDQNLRSALEFYFVAALDIS